MRFFTGLSIAILVVAARCGGQVQGSGDGGVPCPTTSPGGTTCTTDKAQCSFQGTVCGQSASVTCTCFQGLWTCPQSKCPTPTCPSSLAQGTPCTTTGEVCPMSVGGQCGTVNCTCDGAMFQCDNPTCPAPVCPPPASVAPGVSCTLPLGMPCATTSFTCDGGVSGDVFCECTNGAWACNGPQPDCEAGAPDASLADAPAD